MNDRYRLDHEIGDGDDAFVYEALDRQLQRKVAIRFLKPNVSTSIRERLLKEARALAAVYHPSVVTIHEIAEMINPKSQEVEQCVVMQYIEGPTLATRLHQDITREFALKLGDDLLSGLGHMHQCKVAHGDLHEENIKYDILGDRLIMFDIKYWDNPHSISTVSFQTKISRDLYGVCRCLVRVIQRAAGHSAAREFEDSTRNPTDLSTVGSCFRRSLTGGNDE